MSRNALTRYTARHLRIRRLVQFIFAETVRNNALTNRAALLCRTLLRVTRLCSRNVSDPANMRIHGAQSASMRKKKSSAVLLFGAVAGLWSAPDYLIRERQEFKEEGKPQVVLPFCPPPWVRHRPRRGCGSLPRSAERNSLLRFSEKLSAR